MATLLVTNEGALFVVSGLPDQDLSTTDSPTFVTVKLSSLSDSYIPYHYSDAVGLVDSSMRVDASNDFYITAGSMVLPASEYYNLGGTQGTTGYGLRDNAGQIEVKDSGGNWREVKPVAVGGYYMNSTGANPSTELGYGTWIQVAQGSFLVGAT